MKKLIYILGLMPLFIALPSLVKAQDENGAIREGNKQYHQGQYDKALPEYQKAITQNPGSSVARYNLANARYRTGNLPEAEKSFDELIEKTPEKNYKVKGYYNKGVTLTKQKKLLESIQAYKNALKLDPTDEDARFNLQKALMELKKQTQGQEQKQPQQKQQQKKQQNNKLDKKKIEQYLKSLEQKEQEVQRKIQQNRSRSVSQPEKDW
ncbi:tetratricopeptide repeat protein [Niastella caeni]|uniref:Tetratricopeptide repeat protein n=1 Tax=Niastella caeni TaxID=2569763 RepID=A0A4S8I2K6_9BACT|nr:tetratricopeptide repeat protein [Niastella caeni]THU41589.1 tetratricopeptide repeat protein [Niastella caeni]